MHYAQGRAFGCRGTTFRRQVGGASMLVSGMVALVLKGVVPAAHPQQQATAALSLVFDGVTLVDVEHGKLVPDQRVVIAGNRIAAVGGVGAIKMPKGVRVVEAKGKYLIPGLWDMHVHPAHKTDIYYPLFIANGVTGIRDAGSDVLLDTLILWRREILAGARVGPPRQILSGPNINDSCGHSLPVSVCAGTPAHARRLVDSLKAAGADMIKPRDVSLAVYFSIAAEARRLGIPFGGHISWEAVGQGITYLEASDSGAKIIDHDPMKVKEVFNCWGPTTTVELCQPIAERFRRNGTWWVPTLIPYGRSALGPRSRAVYARFESEIAQYWSDSARPASSLAGAFSDSGYVHPGGGPAAASLGYGSVAQRVGMPMLVGTDSYAPKSMKTIPPGLSLHAELAFYVAEGLTPLNALQAATLNPAKALRATDSLGTVAPGKLADLVLLDADPLTDITNTTTIRAVMANGRYFHRAALDSLLARVQAKGP